MVASAVPSFIHAKTIAAATRQTDRCRDVVRRTGVYGSAAAECAERAEQSKFSLGAPDFDNRGRTDLTGGHEPA